ncbi:MAG TPA: hypothetical protein DDW21_06565 [Verrucomicrobiales bacterium]|nr:MAG: hypothetical protein CAK88_02295 [Verrucomicrobiae bacterium AMD-G2]HBE23096.1 hypothetical protein [Verrucomicrobiales bacterium]
MDEEPIIKLGTSDSSQSSRRVVRLDDVKKNRTPKLADSMRKFKTPGVRIVEEQESTPPQQDEPFVMQEQTRRKNFEGKSIGYNIDEIMQHDVYDPCAIEKEWGGKTKTLPFGWISLFSTLIIAALVYIGYLVFTSEHKEAQIVQQQNTTLRFNEMEESDARAVVTAIDQTVKAYLAASSIEEKLRYVRYPDVIKARMMHHYHTRPITPLKAVTTTGYEPLTLGGKTFWRVIAPLDDVTGEALLIEQIEKDQVKIDWESHVYYQPMAWDNYINEKPSRPIAFRLKTKPTNRYLMEFADESRWCCYELTEKDSSKTLYGYVARNSQAHASIHNSYLAGKRTFILRLQASKALKSPDSVVIDKYISNDIHRIDPPTTIED